MEINNEELDKFNIIQIEKNKNHKKKLFSNEFNESCDIMFKLNLNNNQIFLFDEDDKMISVLGKFIIIKNFKFK